MKILSFLNSHLFEFMRHIIRTQLIKKKKLLRSNKYRISSRLDAFFLKILVMCIN